MGCPPIGPPPRQLRISWGKLALCLVLAACSAGSTRAAAPTTTTTTAAPTTTTTTLPTTTTTIDPGLLPQTAQKPSATDPQFLARIQLLWQAVVSGDATVGEPAFFPLSAYLQVKAIANPDADWHHRLLALYDRDITALHGQIPPGAQLVGIDVPEQAATWVLPGQEYNKLPYWRVYDSVVRYTAAGRAGSFTIISLISWRGEWYVVHFRTPPS